MANLDFIKENIDLQREVGRNSTDDVLRDEYLIPDTHPDVKKILSVDVRKKINNIEVQTGKILVDADITYSIIYLSDEDEGRAANDVVYKAKLSNFIDIVGAEQGMFCNVECELEHINTVLINERKINVEAYFRSKCEVYKEETIEFVKSVEGREDIQVRKKIDSIEKILFNKNFNMKVKNQLKVTMDKPQIEKILKFDVILHKKEVKLLDGRVQYSCYAKVNLLYKSPESRELYALEDDVFIADSADLENVNSDMNCDYRFTLSNADYKVSQDDLGESRIIDLDFSVDLAAKVSSLEDIEIMEDAYSPLKELDIDKERTNLKIMFGKGSTETLAKDNIRLENDEEPTQIMSVTGDIISMDAEVKNGMIEVEGLIRVNTLYKSSNEEVGYGNKTADLPFTATIDIEGLKDDMPIDVKGTLESIQAGIEAGTIAVKAIISVEGKANYEASKEYVKNIVEDEEAEVPEKKASVIIYVVQAGDSLWNLAKKYKTTMSDIASLNGLDLNSQLEIGTKLLIPGRARV